MSAAEEYDEIPCDGALRSDDDLLADSDEEKPDDIPEREAYIGITGKEPGDPRTQTAPSKNSSCCLLI